MIGIICAKQIEADGIIALMENKKQREIAKMTFTSGTLNGKELVVVVCGVGKVNAAMCSFAMIQNYKPDCIINSGVAGSVSEKVSVGDIVVAVNVVEHDMNTTALGDLQGEVSFPESKVMYFNCDEKIADKLFASANKLENTRAEKGTIASGGRVLAERIIASETENLKDYLASLGEDQRVREARDDPGESASASDQYEQLSECRVSWEMRSTFRQKEFVCLTVAAQWVMESQLEVKCQVV